MSFFYFDKNKIFVINALFSALFAKIVFYIDRTQKDAKNGVFNGVFAKKKAAAKTAKAF